MTPELMTPELMTPELMTPELMTPELMTPEPYQLTNLFIYMFFTFDLYLTCFSSTYSKSVINNDFKVSIYNIIW